MFGSLKLGKFFGIDLYIHSTFWLLPLYVLFSRASAGNMSNAVFDVVVLFGVFGCIALHEVGHALAARYYGIGTRDITLYPMGGIARLERMTERPFPEIVIALAGPAVNLVIAAGLFVCLLASNIVLADSLAISDDIVVVFAEKLLVANLFLFGFNLLPAFPMDGGRVFRAVLGLFGMRRLEATKVAVGVGAVIAIAFGLAGLLLPNMNMSLILVGVVVFFLGQAELAAVHAQDVRHRSREMSDEDFEPPVTHRQGSFSGWTWDPVRRVWGEWRHGVLVREVPVV